VVGNESEMIAERPNGSTKGIVRRARIRAHIGFPPVDDRRFFVESATHIALPVISPNDPRSKPSVDNNGDVGSIREREIGRGDRFGAS